MVAPKCSDEEFRAAWIAQDGRAVEVGKLLGMSLRRVYMRRNVLEAKFGQMLNSAGGAHHKGRGDAGEPPNAYLQRITLDGFEGVCIVSSDHHYWPGETTLAHRALLEVTKELKPKLSILNGDVFDGARLSRFPRNGWESQPKVKDELEEAQERVAEIRHACLRAQNLRTIGNHCIRFDRYLAAHAGEMEQVYGTRLADHLPAWKECVSVFVNGHTMVKHRFHGGIHSSYNNTLRAGTNIVTGHTHLLEVKPWSDYNGRRYGVSTGAIADVKGPQFGYLEDAPTNWCSGFAVLTFDRAGRLLYPEIAECIDGKCYFRGQVVVSETKKARKNGVVPA